VQGYYDGFENGPQQQQRQEDKLEEQADNFHPTSKKTISHQG
jgi:hypothetical protein